MAKKVGWKKEGCYLIKNQYSTLLVQVRNYEDLNGEAREKKIRQIKDFFLRETPQYMIRC